jgi:hypothetical protein
MIEVILSREEMLQAAIVGVRRRVESLYRNFFNNKRSGRDDDWKNDVEGAAGEAAAAKGLGLKWNAGVNTPEDPDIGNRTEARQTVLTPDMRPHLFIRDRDTNDDRLYILVSGEHGIYKLLGWMRCGDAKIARWRRTDCWMVPAGLLSQDWTRLIEDECQS